MWVVDKWRERQEIRRMHEEYERYRRRQQITILGANAEWAEYFRESDKRIADAIYAMSKEKHANSTR